MQPRRKPANPNFSSGPCAKRPGYDLGRLPTASLGRSHRSALGKARLAAAIAQTRELLEIPADYRVGIVPASDTGAFEMAMWGMLGCRPVDIFHWESFGSGWAADAIEHLRLAQVNSYRADYGRLPDLSRADPQNDCLFTYNGTTSGVRVPDLEWISEARAGLTFCDATSAVFAVSIDWRKVDVLTFSWQKVLGGEGGHGMLVLSPRAVERLECYRPEWPLPKIFRLTKNGALIAGIFKGATINTPSMLAVEDYLDALGWVESIGGLPATIARCDANLAVIERFVAAHAWLDFLAAGPAERSNTSVCLRLDLPDERVAALVGLLEEHAVAYDIAAYRDAPAGLRIWCGATVAAADIELLMPWIEWGYRQVCV
ncbi:MAG: phosphoserine transaminase [Cellvibrionales bacterium]|nr:phosphoserine transaminase [Cellvibrionales bacterium]